MLTSRDVQRRLLQESCTLAEGATHAVTSTVPGVKWEVEKDSDGFSLRLLHSGGKSFWMSGSDVVSKDELDSAIRLLDRFVKETGIDFSKSETDLLATPNIGSAISGLHQRIDHAKRKVGERDSLGSIGAKIVKFQESIKNLDTLTRLQAALRKGEVREDDQEDRNEP